jgi:hypothetical protein
MATVHGVAGEWARVKGMVSGLWPLFLGVFAAGFSVAALAFGVVAFGVALLAASLAYCGWSLMKGLRHAERFFKGARGEERVSGILKDLPGPYHVFNDFVACGTHVDHVVAGPAGVFAVETKFWRGKVTVEDGHILLDGQLPDRDPLSQTRREAQLVKSALAAAGWNGCVTPVLAFASDNFAQHIAEIQGAVVINSCDLGGSFATERVVIPPVELDRLVALMESNS